MTTAEPKERAKIEPGWDVVDGVLVERDMGNESDYVGANFITLVNVHVKRRKLGRVFGASAGYQYPALDNGRRKFPDVSYVANERLADGGQKMPGPTGRSLRRAETENSGSGRSVVVLGRRRD